MFDKKYCMLLCHPVILHHHIQLIQHNIVMPHLYFTVPFCIIYHTTVFVLCRVESYSYHSVKCLYCNSTPLYSHCSLWQCFSTWGSQLPQGTESYSISRRMQDGCLDERPWKICFRHKYMLLFSDFTLFCPFPCKLLKHCALSEHLYNQLCISYHVIAG